MVYRVFGNVVQCFSVREEISLVIILILYNLKNYVMNKSKDPRLRLIIAILVIMSVIIVKEATPTIVIE